MNNFLAKLSKYNLYILIGEMMHKFPELPFDIDIGRRTVI